MVLKILDAIVDTPKLRLMVILVLVIGAIGYVYAHHYLAFPVVKVDSLAEYINYTNRTHTTNEQQIEEISLIQVRQTPMGLLEPRYGKRYGELRYGYKVAWEWLFQEELNLSWLTIEAVQFQRHFSNDEEYFTCSVFYSTSWRTQTILPLRENLIEWRSAEKGVTPDRTYFGCFWFRLEEEQHEDTIHLDIVHDKSWRRVLHLSEAGFNFVRNDFRYIGRLWVDNPLAEK